MHRRITIQSPRYRATARYRPDGSITCTTKALAGAKAKRDREPNLRKARIVLGILLMLFVAETIWGVWIFRRHLTIADPPAMKHMLGPLGLLLLVFLGVVFAMLSHSLRRVATWHAAEHMAIMAYHHARTSDAAVIRAQPAIVAECGGRFVAPVALAVLPVVFWGVAVQPIDTIGLVGFTITLLLVMVSSLLAILCVDTIRKWSELPGFRQATHRVQQHFTIRPPGEAELNTAQRALEELLKVDAKL